SLAGAPCAPPLCGNEYTILVRCRITVLTTLARAPAPAPAWGPPPPHTGPPSSGPGPGSAPSGAPTAPRRSLAGAPCAPPLCGNEYTILVRCRITVLTPLAPAPAPPPSGDGPQTTLLF